MRYDVLTKKVGDPIRDGGYFTHALYFRGVDSRKIEDRVGYKAGRLAHGYVLLFMTRLPKPEEFELRGLSQLSGGVEFGHRQSGPNVDEIARQDPASYAVKKRLAMSAFTLEGSRRLARVIPLRSEFGEGPQYPPGRGIPQWTSARGMSLDYVVAAHVSPGSIYEGDYT